MKKITVIYWSGTGNTEAMAQAVAEGAAVGDSEVKVLTVDQASIEDVTGASAVALGCPAMGNEVLEETVMEPFIASLQAEGLGAVPLVLFGSYDWGDEQWMRDWADRMKSMGFQLVTEGLAVQNSPDEAALDRCRELGEKLISG
jgi:flavodoxin I